MQIRLRPLVFWPTFLILMAAVLASYVNLDLFLKVTSDLNNLVLDHFSWLFSLTALFLLVVAVVVYLSPLGRVKIGGAHAQPMLSPIRWLCVNLSTTMAVGILFWTTAEPLYHVMAPPESLGLEPGSSGATLFSMSSMFMHWGFIPYAIYAVPSLIFALVFYNLKLRFSITSMLVPLFGQRIQKYAGLIDCIALYSLVAGMASSLGTGALSMLGGANQYLGGNTTPLGLAITVAIIVIAYVASSAIGLNKGIAALSSCNMWLMLLLGIFVFVCGPTTYLLNLGTESFGVYLDNFFTKSLFTGAAGNDDWPHSWTIFYWAVWYSWAPMAALFLGEISRGYSVRDVLKYNLFMPAIAACVWVTIFSGTAIHDQLHLHVDLYGILNKDGMENAMYALIGHLPLASFWVPVLLFIAFISYVTGADAQTTAISNLCVRGLDPEGDIDSGLPLKVIWGAIVGVVAWVMVAFVGVDGIKMLSNLGGFPAMVIVVLSSLSLFRWMKDPSLVDVPQEIEPPPANKRNVHQ